MILALAVVVRVAVVIVWTRQIGPESFGFGDSISYWRLAGAIGRGEPYEFGWEGARCFRAPGYPLWLSWLFMIWSEPPILAARALGVAVGVGVVAATFALAERFAGRTVACWAGTLAAIHPELALSSGLVLSETLFDLLLLLQCSAWLRRREAGAGGKRLCGAIELGIWTGLSVLVRPSWLPAVAIWGLGLLVQIGRRPKNVVPIAAAPPSAARADVSDSLPAAHPRSGPGGRERLVSALALALTFSAVMSPWWIRNAVTFGTFVPTTLQTGAGLYDAWNPQADGGSNMRPIDAQRLAFLRQTAARYLERDELQEWTLRLPTHSESPDYWPRLRREAPLLWERLLQVDHSLPEFEVAFDKHLSDQAQAWAAANPARVASLAFDKLLRLWSPWPQEGIGRSVVARAVLALGWIALVVAVVSGARGAARLPDAWILVAPALLLTALHLIYVASIRYREPALPGLLIIGAIGIASIARRLSLGKRGPFR